MSAWVWTNTPPPAPCDDDLSCHTSGCPDHDGYNPADEDDTDPAESGVVPAPADPKEKP